ncbi:MAG: PilZ domain-containing protein [Pseudomonadota bacterium]|nr:PilZ domain-containing protein [Pseudomonadota bacterium]
MEEGEYLFDVTDIVAHLFFAVGTTDEVRVTSPAGEFLGTFAYPEGDEVYVQVDEKCPALTPGMALFVDYEGAEANYRFHTEVVSVHPNQIQIRLPYAIECSDRRLTQRKAVAPDAGFWFVAEGGGPELSFVLSDLSDGGVGFINAHNVRIQIGDSLRGVVYLPDQTALQVVLDVRHLPVREGQRFVGARFTAISLADRGRLARFLVTL